MARPARRRILIPDNSHDKTSQAWKGIGDGRDAEIRRWLADPRVAVLITNRPGDAVAMRG
jgi:hypothetical protein